MSESGQKMEKKRPRISLSLLSALTESISRTKKSPRIFENGGAVGLGIVAAMGDDSCESSAKVSSLDLSPRSKPVSANPVSAVSLKKPASFFNEGANGLLDLNKEPDAAVIDENDESYTCVVSHVGKNVVKKSVYYGDRAFPYSVSEFAHSGLLNAPLPGMVPMDACAVKRREFWSRDFLSSCYICKKVLEGRDIYMYRGEIGFCRPECRDKYISIEDLKEKFRSEAQKQEECSLLSGSSPLLFFAGVAAA